MVRLDYLHTGDLVRHLEYCFWFCLTVGPHSLFLGANGSILNSIRFDDHFGGPSVVVFILGLGKPTLGRRHLPQVLLLPLLLRH